MVDDHAVSGIRHHRIMEWQVPTIEVRLLSRVRVRRYVIAGVDHRSSSGCKDLAAPASSRRILVGIVELLCIVGIQAAHVDGKGIPIAAVAAVRDPVLPKNALASKGEAERRLLLVGPNRNPQRPFGLTALPICDCEPDSCGV